MDNPQNSTGPKEAPKLVRLVVWELGRNLHLLFAHEPGAKNPAAKGLLRVAVTNNALFERGMVIECRHRGADYYECSGPPPKKPAAPLPQGETPSRS
jgi:hypothetical protein